MATVTSNTTATNKVLPYQDPNNPLAPVQQVPNKIAANSIQPVGAGAAAAPGMNNQLYSDVVNKAGQTALTGYQSQTMPLLQDATQNLLKNPTQGIDPNYSNMQVEKLRRDNQNAYETARQGMAPVAGSAEQQRDLLKTAMTNVENEQMYKSDLDQQLAKLRADSLNAAISTGQKQVGTEQSVIDSNVANLATAAKTGDTSNALNAQANQSAMDNGIKIAMANQDAELQTALANISQAGQTGRQLSAQDFQSAQSGLDRAQEAALKAGDWKSLLDIENLRGDISTKAQTAGFAQQTSERLGSQGFLAAQAQLEFAQQKALAAGDQAAAEKLETIKGTFAAQAQANAQDFQGSQASLDRALESAIKTGDWESVLNVEKLRGDISAKAQASGQEFESSQNSLDRAQESSMKNGDWESVLKVESLRGQIAAKAQASGQEWQAGENLADRIFKSGERVSTQDFQSIQASLDRQQTEALKNGDWANVMNVEKLRGEIQDKYQAKELEWKTGERISDQSWKTGERISGEDFTTAMNTLDQKAKEALQKNDISAQADIADKQMKLQLAMQTNGMAQEEKMAYLKNSLAEATANGDVERQKSILTFQYGQEMEKTIQAQGFETAMENIKAYREASLKEGDWRNAQTLQQMQIEATAEQHAQDLALEEAKTALQAKGIDMQAVQQRYELLLDQDPTAAFNYLQQQMAGTGITLQAKDALTAAKESLKADWESQKYQFALMHESDKLLVDPTTKELTPEGQLKLTKFLDDSYFNTDAVKKAVDDAAAAAAAKPGTGTRRSSSSGV